MILNKGESERIKRKLPRHLIKDFAQDNVKKGIPFVQALIQRGVLREQDPEVINGVLHAIMLLRLHKEELGEDLFPKIMDEIIDYIAEGLTKPG